jgi:hypothetical protein
MASKVVLVKGRHNRIKNLQQFGKTASMQRLRNRTGQALIESAAGLVVLTLVFVFLTAFGLNVFWMLQYQAKANIVASESAKVVAADKYWLGMLRPDYNADGAKQRARDVAKALCTKLGLPEPSEFQVDETSDTYADYLSVNLTLSGLKLPFGLSGVFPGVFKTQANGASVQPKQAIYACMNMDCLTAETGTYDIVSIPVYGFTKGHGQNPDPNDLNRGYERMSGFPNNFGSTGPISPKYFRGLPLRNEKWDPRLINFSKGPGSLDGTSH